MLKVAETKVVTEDEFVKLLSDHPLSDMSVDACRAIYRHLENKPLAKVPHIDEIALDYGEFMSVWQALDELDLDNTPCSGEAEAMDVIGAVYEVITISKNHFVVGDEK